MVEIGYFSLCLALVAAGYALVASLVGARRQHLGLVRSGEIGSRLGFASLSGAPVQYGKLAGCSARRASIIELH